MRSVIHRITGIGLYDTSEGGFGFPLGARKEALARHLLGVALTDAGHIFDGVVAEETDVDLTAGVEGEGEDAPAYTDETVVCEGFQDSLSSQLIIDRS